MKVYFEIIECDPEREFLQVKFWNDDGQEYWRNTLPEDWSPEAIQQEVECYGPYIVAYWNRIKNRTAAMKSQYTMSGSFEAEEQIVITGAYPDPKYKDEPEYDPWTQRIEAEQFELGVDEWVGWVVIDLTPEEQAEFERVALQDIRAQRNYFLACTDYIFSPDAKVDNMEAMVKYRQELRDVPQQEGFPKNFTWPTHPSEE